MCRFLDALKVDSWDKGLAILGRLGQQPVLACEEEVGAKLSLELRRSPHRSLGGCGRGRLGAGGDGGIRFYGGCRNGVVLSRGEVRSGSEIDLAGSRGKAEVLANAGVLEQVDPGLTLVACGVEDDVVILHRDGGGGEIAEGELERLPARGVGTRCRSKEQVSRGGDVIVARNLHRVDGGIGPNVDSRLGRLGCLRSASNLSVQSLVVDDLVELKPSDEQGIKRIRGIALTASRVRGFTTP